MILLLEALFMAFATFRNVLYFIEVKHAFNKKKTKTKIPRNYSDNFGVITFFMLNQFLELPKKRLGRPFSIFRPTQAYVHCTVTTSQT